MERMGVRQLQQNAARAVRRVRKGERIEVTDRGRPVAVLVPVTHESVLDALEAAGRLVRAEGDALDVGPPIRMPRRAEPPSRRLARLRAAER
jgi:prevent-host-death family protein